jgi:hypothetical protein
LPRLILPNGDSPSWKLLAAYALASEKKQASGIVEALESAIYRAKQDGRDEVMFNDIQAALIHDHGFAPAARATKREFAKPQKHPCKRAAAGIREQCKAANFQVLAPADGRREAGPNSNVNGIRANTVCQSGQRDFGSRAATALA